jgi:hypothetical protein
VAGELIPSAAGGSSGPPRGSPFGDFVGLLRRYIAPPPPSELGWQASIGAAMTLAAGCALALLPSGATIAAAGLFKWVARGALASTVGSSHGFCVPLLIAGAAVLLVTAAIYAFRWGTMPALLFLTAQSWIGVITLAGASLVWIYLLVVLVANVLIWILYGSLLFGIAVFVIAIVIGMVGGLLR